MTSLSTIDVHVAGEPLRVITKGFPDLPGHTLLEKRQNARERFDELRKALMLEPRGHRDMYGALLLSPCIPEADFSVLFLHNEGYSTMCGHGIIGLATVLLEEGLFPSTEPETTINFETPSGLVTATASMLNGTVQSVSFRNVPSYVTAQNQVMSISGVGALRYDVAFGGAYYVFCQASDLNLSLRRQHASQLIDVGMRIKEAVAPLTYLFPHPIDEALEFLYGTIFVGDAELPGSNCRQVCIFADGALDRSPTGTGVSALLALQQAKEAMTVGQSIVVESILGTTFTGRIHESLEYEGLQAVIPEVEGRAYLTGKHEFLIDSEDPLSAGFRIS